MSIHRIYTIGCTLKGTTDRIYSSFDSYNEAKHALDIVLKWSCFTKVRLYKQTIPFGRGKEKIEQLYPPITISQDAGQEASCPAILRSKLSQVLPSLS